MATKIPMVFSLKTTSTTEPAPTPAPAPSPAPAPQPVTQTLASRFTMHDLYKVAKKGCKSCGS